MDAIPDILSMVIQEIIFGGQDNVQTENQGVEIRDESPPVDNEEFSFEDMIKSPPLDITDGLWQEDFCDDTNSPEFILGLECSTEIKEEPLRDEERGSDIKMEMRDEPLQQDTSITHVKKEKSSIENIINIPFREAVWLEDVGGNNYDDVQSSEFIAGLPHRECLLKVAAEEFGAPYLPDEKSVSAVENFWAKDNRKERYLSHIRGNDFIAGFISGIIDAKTCVGMLRSIATEYGYKSIYNVAKMTVKTVVATEVGKSPPNNSFCVEVKDLLCGDEKPVAAAASVKKPDSLHPLLSLENSEIFKKMKNPTTKGVSLDWSETAAVIDSASCRNVAVLTNLICAIIMPAYTFDEVLALNGESERAILRQHAAAVDIAEDKKDVVDEMCVLACIHSLVQYFSISESSSHHLFSAPLRLPPFDKHPVINLKGSKVFFPDEKVENVVATMSVPAHSTFVLNYRNERKGKKILCETTDGITAHIMPPKPRRSKNKTKTRDPFIYLNKKDRPLLTRNMLILSGNYGWFGLTLGHTSSADILFAESDSDGLFSPSIIRKYRKKDISATPFRNRYLDLRFGSVEITEAMGYTSCFRIRPASLCNSNNMSADISLGKIDNNTWTGNVVTGSNNPFVTRMGYPRWYKPEALSDIFGEVNLKDHVAALDHTMDKFVKLLEGDQRWKANQKEKITVLNDCIVVLVQRQKDLAKRIEAEFGKPISLEKSGNGFSLFLNCRKKCNNIESAIIAAVQQYSGKNKRQKRLEEGETLADLQTSFQRATDAISMCRMLMNECQNHSERFFEGECRIAAHDLYKYIYRNSARQYIRSCLIRGVKMSVLWRRPYDECADKALADVPRCRIPQLIIGVENILERRRIEGQEELFLPGLQIFNTRDMNPRPMHYILLAMMYGKKLAKDISAVNCLEWMNWCTKTAGEKTGEEELVPLVRHNSDYTKKRKRRREEEQDTITNLFSEIIYDKSMPVYDIMFPEAVSRKRRTNKKKKHGKEEEEEEDEKEKISSLEAFVWPPKKRTVCCTKKKLDTANKMRTGRLGYKDIYLVALTSLPQRLSNIVENVAKDMDFITEM